MEGLKNKEISLETINNGAAVELFSYEFDRVLKNLCDINTKTKEKRKITLDFVFEIDEDRENIRCSIGSKTKLSEVKPTTTHILVDGKNLKNPKAVELSAFQATLPFDNVKEIGVK